MNRTSCCEHDRANEEPCQSRRLVRSVDGKPAGTIRGRIFHKRVVESKHRFRLLDAYGLDAALFQREVLPHCDWIEVYDVESQTLLRVSVSAFAKYAIKNIRAFGGFGAQWFLPLKFFHVEGNKKQPASQLSLFPAGQS